MYPQEFLYTKEHEWIKVETDRGTVGITNYAQKQLGDVVYIELPEVGAKFRAMDVFGTIESVKAVSELFCPVSAQVLEINEKLAASPEMVNEDPHGKAWLMRIRLLDPGELKALLSAPEYEEYVEKEGGD